MDKLEGRLKPYNLNPAFFFALWFGALPLREMGSFEVYHRYTDGPHHLSLLLACQFLLVPIGTQRLSGETGGLTSVTLHFMPQGLRQTHLSFLFVVVGDDHCSALHLRIQLYPTNVIKSTENTVPWFSLLSLLLSEMLCFSTNSSEPDATCIRVFWRTTFFKSGSLWGTGAQLSVSLT